ncbi:exonuclease domain-containing protein [Gulosibacter molinativorax]|uniref:exonuclease domain-containing protein n=1 Tax=Gulosibacter molinativorax TaxID=256821 RepID=UPI000422B5FD|nr:exonuclease domain-containing protein [Gulosibacter molinativorax]QUY62527.1 Exonuclease, DNA polymerase III, epsilon subunit family [Gulosibacter molinativorax]
MSFAVVDLETTGFSPARGDRIVELGVVLLDDGGAVEQEWTTLVNPQRHIGATHVHGIRARDVVDAPLFGDVAADVVDLLAGRTIVAHNQAFDTRFLRAELSLHGFVIPDSYSALCTMVWSRRRFGAAKLADVCAALGIDLTDAHSALGDAKATANLLRALNEVAGRDRDWARDVARGVFPIERSITHAAGRLTARDVAATGSPIPEAAEPPLWQRVTVPLPAGDVAACVYLELLADVLDDGFISVTEHERLRSIAEVAGFDEGRLPELHAKYLEAATAEALADGSISDAEREQLVQIALVLDLPFPDLRRASSDVSAVGRASLVGRPAVVDDAAPATGAAFSLSPGCRVVFTGTMSCPREEWAQRLVAAGLTTGTVTKKTAVLVAEDPTTQSGKGKNALKYGIPVVTEEEFAPVFDAYVSTLSTNSN